MWVWWNVGSESLCVVVGIWCVGTCDDVGVGVDVSVGIGVVGVC